MVVRILLLDLVTIKDKDVEVKILPRTTFDTSASMNEYATNQYFHFMKKYTKNMFGCPC
jgi:hypothetical protein